MPRAMYTPWRQALLAVLLAGASLTAGCGRNGPEGKYRDPTGNINVEFKDGQASLSVGTTVEHGTYTVDGKKIIVTGDLEPMIGSPAVFTVNHEETIDGPRGSVFPRMERVR
jgi:hypothetical protein